MPAKYSHVKKRTASGLLRKSGSQLTITKDPSHVPHSHHHSHHHQHNNSHPPKLNPHIDRALSAVSQLERAIAKVLLIRYEQDIARLFSGPGWLAWNYDSEEVKDFMRGAIAMDMRQAGEESPPRALSNNVTICHKRGLHSSVFSHYPLLKAHLESLESMPPRHSASPPFRLLKEGLDALDEACRTFEIRSSSLLVQTRHDSTKEIHEDPPTLHQKLTYGYEKACQTLWSVAREFDVRGYGTVLREKLTSKWCDCGCSTDHLGGCVKGL
ncbi:hypothetical protein BDQ17DRAFT_1435375 [Cyathus striatus]|nr:hypothetical protein BDQ17DRAFT_1435375 [Cyathus striatus]